MDPVTVAAIAAAISATAALLSLIALFVSVWLQWQVSTPRVDVVGQLHTLIAATHVGETRFGIDVRNVGNVAVTVTAVGVLFRGGQKGVLPTARTLLNEYVLPKRLEPGEAVSLSNELEPIAEAHRERGIVAVYAATAAGREYHGPVNARL